METERHLLSTGELRIIEVLGKHGPLGRWEIGRLVKPTSIFRFGKKEFDLFDKLKKKGLIVETPPRIDRLVDSEQYDLSDKGHQAYRLVNRIDRARKALRQVLESQ